MPHAKYYFQFLFYTLYLAKPLQGSVYRLLPPPPSFLAPALKPILERNRTVAMMIGTVAMIIGTLGMIIGTLGIAIGTVGMIIGTFLMTMEQLELQLELLELQLELLE